MPKKRSKKKYIVEKGSGLVVSRFISERPKGIVNPNKSVLIGSWFQEYPKKDYRVVSTTRKIDFFKTKIRKRR